MKAPSQLCTFRQSTHAALLLLIWLVTTMLLWLIAFYRLPSGNPDWLLRAQSACFGTNESGLPDARGWMVLVLSPLSLAGALWIALPGDVLNGARLLRTWPPLRHLFTLLIVLALTEAGYVSLRLREALAIERSSEWQLHATALPSNYPRLNRQASPFELVDQHGQAVTLQSLEGSVVLMTFAYAHCATVCPGLVKSVVDAAHRFPGQPVKAVVITLDPWRDTPSSLRTRAKRWGFGPRDSYLSGAVDAVEAVLTDYQVPRQRNPRTGHVTHPPLTYVLSKEGELVYAFNNAPVPWLIEAVTRVLEQ